MPLTLQQLLAELGQARPGQPAQTPLITAASPDEVEAAFQALDGLFAFTRFGADGRPSGLRPNPAVTLNQAETRVVEQLVDGADRHLRAGHVRLMRAPNREFVLASMEPEVEDTAEASAAAMPAGAMAAACKMRKWLKWRWWGLRLTLNHCSVTVIAKAGAALSAVIASLGLPAIAATVIAAAAGLLTAVDQGEGVRIYITWAGAFWMKPCC